jgi:hypothetical protein
VSMHLRAVCPDYFIADRLHVCRQLELC